MTNIVSSVKIQGFLQVRVHDAKTGALVYREDKPNLICVGSRKAMAKLAAQRSTVDEPTYDKIWAIYAGDSSTTPVSSQTWLQGTNITKKAVTQPVTIVTSDDSGIVEVTSTFGTSDHNNWYIREVGLFTRGDNDDPTLADEDLVTMLARQIHGKIYKTSAISVSYTWRYQFTT